MAIDLELRRRCITSTDIGPIFGVDEWRDAFSVWAAKKGEIELPAPTPRMRLGTFLQKGIMEAYSAFTGRPTIWIDKTYQHPERAWMACSPDAIVTGERRGVDAKLVFFDQRRKWGANPNDIPESIQLQMWWMMAVTDYEAWDVAALIGEDMPRVYEFQRDLEAERVMIARADEFYRRYIVGNEVPPIGGSAAAGIWLKQAFPTHKPADLRPATEAEIAAMEVYARLKYEEKELKKHKEALENEIKLAIGEQEGVFWPGGKFTWKLVKGRKVTNWEEIARGLFNQYVPDLELRQKLEELQTYTEKGYRRIWFDSDFLREMSDAA
jgi:predicted phage-related endonuclease